MKPIADRILGVDGWETGIALPPNGDACMPLYFFDITDGTRECDLEGSEFPSLDEARTQAIKFTGELLRHHSDIIWEGHDLKVEVSNGDRVPLFTVVVSAVSLFPDP